MLTVPVMSQPFENMIYRRFFPLFFYKLYMMLFIRKTVLFCGQVIFILSILLRFVYHYRSNLGSVVLQLKKLGIDDLVHFDFMDPPGRHHYY